MVKEKELNIYVYDDEYFLNPIAQDNLREELILTEKTIAFFGNVQGALDLIKTKSPDSLILVIDIILPEQDGIQFINSLKQNNLSHKIIAISAHKKTEEIYNQTSNNPNIIAVYEKPLDSEKINEINEFIRKKYNLNPSQNFDYSALDKETADFIENQTGEIRVLMKQTAQGIFEIGQILIQIKQKLGHGRFLNWLKTEFNWSERTARNFMRVAEEFKTADFADLAIAPSALYELAAPSTPEAAKIEAFSRAKAGEVITYTAVKEITQKYKLQKHTESKTSKDEKAISKTETAQETCLKPTLPVSDQKTAISPLQRNQEILAIIPKKLKEQEIKETSQQQGGWWQLGEHLLYCGNPNEVEFKEKLPQKIALSLAFPDIPDWKLDIPSQAYSEMAFFSRHQDLEPTTLREIVERGILLCTESEDVVVFSFMPDPILLLIAHNLNCCCFVAEPDEKRCEQIIVTWKRIGAKVNKL